MPDKIDASLRTAESYNLGRRALEMMQAAKVWPTPLNYEIWLYCAANPDGALAHEIERLLSANLAITEEQSERLASEYLPSHRAQEQIWAAGDQIQKQLEEVGRAVTAAQKSSAAYGKTLGAASRNLETDQDAEALKRVVETLSVATRRVHEQNRSLEERLTASTEEMSRLRHHLDEVRRDSLTDALTELANRKAFDAALQAACAAADASGGMVGVALLDIDHFKRFNDTWGHQTGDQVLRYVASVLGRSSVSPAMAARYGGEEFALICPGMAPGTLANLLDQIRLEVGSKMLKRRATNEDLGAVTISAGWAMRSPGESCHGATERADQALYASKRGGRNRVTGAEVLVAKAA